MWDAAYSGDFDELFHILVDCHADEGSSPKGGDTEEVSFAREANRQGITLLHLCCFANSVKCVRLLLTLGARVNRADDDGWTPLHAAAAGGHVDVIHVLVAGGAGLEAVDARGRTASDVACNAVSKAALELYGLTFDDCSVVLTANKQITV